MKFRLPPHNQLNIVIFTVGLLASLILGIWRSWFSAISLMIGVLTAIAYLGLIARQVKQLRRSNSSQAKQLAVKGVFIRYLLVMIVLVSGTQIQFINIYWVMGGLLLIPLSSFISVFARKRNEET